MTKEIEKTIAQVNALALDARALAEATTLARVRLPHSSPLNGRLANVAVRLHDFANNVETARGSRQ